MFLFTIVLPISPKFSITFFPLSFAQNHFPLSFGLSRSLLRPISRFVPTLSSAVSLSQGAPSAASHGSILSSLNTSLSWKHPLSPKRKLRTLRKALKKRNPLIDSASHPLKPLDTLYRSQKLGFWFLAVLLQLICLCDGVVGGSI